MNESNVEISVIVPVFNGAPFIAAAIESILAQSCRPAEILVVDDGSTDETAEIVQRFGDSVHYHHQENGGTSVARNNGVRRSRGGLLAFLDADDLWPEHKLARQAEVVREDPGLDLVWGRVIEFSGDKPDTGGGARSVAGHHPGTALIRRKAFDQVGGFSETYQQAEVVEWVSRVMHSGVKQLMLPEVLMYRRVHGSNKGIANPAADQQYLRILKRHLDRTRAK